MIQLENNIETLDPKSSLCFLDNINDSHVAQTPTEVKLSSETNGIWKIENFLSDSECDEIISKCEENGFQDISYRSSKRLIGFDNNANLMNTIKSRLDNNLFNDDFRENKWKTPYGFYTDLIDWNKNIKINPCFRINKYVDSGFDLHRDAQFTENYFVRSNYTLIVYLNDDYEHGSTCFVNPKTKDNYDNINGKTINEEMQNIDYEYIEIKPKKGTAVIFDQRLIHGGSIANGTKYILRTDLIATANKCKNGEDMIKINSPELELEKRIENLTKLLFRQAQYNELGGSPCSELYERCISLRQNPSMLADYPADLESLIQYEIINNYITSELKHIKRSANKHVFEYETKLNNKFNLLKTATLFTILSLTEATFNLKNKNDEILSRINNNGKTIVDDCLDIYTKKDSDDSSDSDDSCELSESQILEITKKQNKKNGTLIPYLFLFDKSKGVKEFDKIIKNIHDEKMISTENELNNEYNKREIMKEFCNGDNSEISSDHGYGQDEMSNIYKNGNCVNTDTVMINEVLEHLFDIDYENIEHTYYKIKPLSIIIKTHNVISDLHAKECYFKCCSEYNEYDNEYFVGHSFDFKTDNYVMNLSNVAFNENIITGKINIELPSESFNHASCQGQHCSYNCTDFYEKNTVVINYEINFTINSKEIILDLIPIVVV
jgi:prolyl 4-hydroxylase